MNISLPVAILVGIAIGLPGAAVGAALLWIAEARASRRNAARAEELRENVDADKLAS